MASASTGDVYSLAAKLKYGKGLDLVIVDYLQFLKDSERGDSEAVRVGKISRNLKSLASLLDVAVIAPAQLNRRVEKAGGDMKGVPLLHDLRDSGNIEQDADVVMMLHRDSTGERQSDAFLRIAKNRKGQVGKFQIRFDKLTTQFTEK
jgi:replicative DNA helicase